MDLEKIRDETQTDNDEGFYSDRHQTNKEAVEYYQHSHILSLKGILYLGVHKGYTNDVIRDEQMFGCYSGRLEIWIKS